MADYNAHLAVSGGGAAAQQQQQQQQQEAGTHSSSNKNLIRGNSVATLNQIYQHHNSIPVRNRILNTAKSLQHPSVDVLELIAPADLSSAPANVNELLQAHCSPNPIHYSTGANSNYVAQTSNISTRQATPGARMSPMQVNQNSIQMNKMQMNQHQSMPVQIINVARRYKKTTCSDSFNTDSSFSSSLGDRAPLQSRNARPERRSFSRLDSSEDSDSSTQSFAAPDKVSPLHSQGLKSPGLSRNNTLEVQHAKSRSPSPIRSSSQQVQLPASIETSPSKSLNLGLQSGSPRRRILPQPGQFQQQQPIDKEEGSKIKSSGSFKRPRKLPQIPQPAANQQQQFIQGQSSRANQFAHYLSQQPSNQFASGLNYQSMQQVAQKAPQQHHLAGEQLRVQSFPMPSSAPASGILCEQRPSKQPAPSERLAYKSKLQLVAGHLNSNSSGSTDTPSPRSPVVLGSSRLTTTASVYQPQSANNAQRTKLSASSSSSTNSPKSGAASYMTTAAATTNTENCSLNATAGFFTFEDQNAGCGGGDADFVCYSPGGSRTAGGPNHDKSAQAEREQTTVAGRGRRLSTCGSGLRANFLMNKQHAISEFTPPRSLESSTSRGSTDWPQAGDVIPGANLLAVQQPAQIPGTRNAATKLQLRQASSALAVNSPAIAGPSGNWSASAQNITRSQLDLPPPAQRTPVDLRAKQQRASSNVGLPPRAASATESSGALTDQAGLLNPNCARSMIAVQLSSCAGNNAPGNSNASASPRRPTSSASILPTAPISLSTQAVQLGRRLTPSLAGGFTTAVSIDVYHCEDSNPSVSLSESTTTNPHDAGRQGSSAAAAAGARQQRVSLIPPQRDRQPSNVSTNSMPAVSYSAPIRQATGSQLNQNAASQPQQATRKFGAWAELIGSDRTSRWVRSASQLGAAAEPSKSRNSKQSSSLSATSSSSGSSSSSASASSSSSDKDRSSSRGSSSSLQSCQSNSTSSSTSNYRTSASSAARNDKGTPIVNRRRTVRVRRSRRPRTRRRSGQTNKPKVKTNLSDEQLTLCDKLKLAERSASKLFRKVELSPHQSSQLPGSRRNSSDSLNNGEHSTMQQQTEELPAKDWSRRSDILPARGQNDDERSDDLSLFLKSADRQRQQERRSRGHRDSGACGRQHSLDNAPVQSAKPDNDDDDDADKSWSKKSKKKTKKVSANGNVCGPEENSHVRRAAKVVQRAITLKSLVRNLSGTQRASSFEPNGATMKQTSPHHNLLSACDSAMQRSARKSAESLLPGPRSQSAVDTPSRQLPIKLRAALFFKRARRSGSSSREFSEEHPHHNLFGGGGGGVGSKKNSLDRDAFKQTSIPAVPPPTPTQVVRAQQQPTEACCFEEKKTVAGNKSSNNSASFNQTRSKRLNRMKSVITAVSRTLEPLKLMGNRQQSLRSECCTTATLQTATTNSMTASNTPPNYNDNLDYKRH